MTPLILATAFKRGSDEKLIAEIARQGGISVEEARAEVEAEIAREQVWVNEKYQVACIKFAHPQLGPCLQINIRRRDGKVIFRDWREFQAIKNQLADPEFEAIELYPAESRLIDQNNKYHLWVVLDPNFRWPFGWNFRAVDDQPSSVRGLRQRKLPKGNGAAA